MSNNLEEEESKLWDSEVKRDSYKGLYPNLNDKYFNRKIAEKQEFDDTKYNGALADINEESIRLCSADFELAPHQQFVKNFLSYNTPYNSLLLYHGLGSGKTCSAIGVAEEMRDYIKHLGINKKIIIVANPNVLENFRLQLFDERKLEQVNSNWNIKNCIGNKLLKEINPLNIQGLPKEKIVKLINSLIDKHYSFFGYLKFANDIEKITILSSENKNKEVIIQKKLEHEYKNTLIIIDEFHNIKNTRDNSKAADILKGNPTKPIKPTKENTKILRNFQLLFNNVRELRLLFLSATPLYNNQEEIIWILNIMNKNDNRDKISKSDVFDKEGNFVEGGKELLRRKATGYISFVRGDNPYTFPFKIWPYDFAPDKTNYDSNKSTIWQSNTAYQGQFIYPSIDYNNQQINDIKYLSLYLVTAEKYQSDVYTITLNNILSKSTNKGINGINEINEINEMDDELEDLDINDEERKVLKKSKNTTQSLGLNLQLLYPLNIVYPNREVMERGVIPMNTSNLIAGISGLESIMDYDKKNLDKFKYKNNIVTEYGRIFSQERIATYSAKIKAICDNIKNSTGIVLIYSKYIAGGVIPMALALEEMGFTRYNNTNSLFETPPIEPLDLKTYENIRSKTSIPAKYIMITGNINLSPNSAQEVIDVTRKENINGNKIKVIIISEAGAEGIDFKFIRQVHILEPWWNFSAIEQIIGRAVRNCSHKDLELKNRNVQLYLYGTIIADTDKEAYDLYLYRNAEDKAIKIGQVTRVLKEVSVDCLLNSSQQNFSAEIMNLTIEQTLSNGASINFNVGDKPFTTNCDFLDSCLYKCHPDDAIKETNSLSYSDSFFNNNEKIIHRIKELFKDKYYYENNELLTQINYKKTFPTLQIFKGLEQLIENNNEIITDKYNRPGRLISLGNYYFFQPLELSDVNISLYERSIPISHKNNKLQIVGLSSSSKTSTPRTPTSSPKGSPKGSPRSSSKGSPNTTPKIKIIKPISQTSEKIKGSAIINKLEEYYNLVISNITNKIIDKRSKDWYVLVGPIIIDFKTILLKDKLSIENDLYELLVSHMLEELLYYDLIDLLNYLYSKEEETLTLFEKNVLNYFKNNELNYNSITGLLLPKFNKIIKKVAYELVIKYKNKDKDGYVWQKALGEDKYDLEQFIENKKLYIKENANIPYGFMGLINKNKESEKLFYKFKAKSTDTGATCVQRNKKIVEDLNKLLSNLDGTTANLELINEKKYKKEEICILEEFLLRLNNKNKTNGKLWFLTPSEDFLFMEK
jgi:superfamily II DNA or RNA helicase